MFTKSQRQLIYLSIMLSIAGCQSIPQEQDKHLVVRLLSNGDYLYEGNTYDAKKLASIIRKDFLSGKIPSKKIELHCLKNFKLTQFADLAIFSQNEIKLVNTEDFRHKTECSKDNVNWRFDD